MYLHVQNLQRNTSILELSTDIFTTVNICEVHSILQSVADYNECLYFSPAHPCDRSSIDGGTSNRLQQLELAATVNQFRVMGLSGARAQPHHAQPTEIERLFRILYY